MENKYTQYLDRAGIVPSEELEPLLFQMDSSYYNKFKTSEWTFLVSSNEDTLYTPIVFPENIFINEVITGLRTNKPLSLQSSELSEAVESSIVSSIEEVSTDFKFILIGNTICVENSSESRYISIKCVYVEKTYDNLRDEFKSILNGLLYNLDLMEPQGLYYIMGKLSSWKKDTLAERIPKRTRVSGVAINIPRRTLR